MSDKKIEDIKVEEKIIHSESKDKSKFSQNPFNSKSEDKSLIKSKSKNDSMIKSKSKIDSIIKSKDKNDSMIKSKSKIDSIKNSQKKNGSIIKEEHSSDYSNSNTNSDSSSYNSNSGSDNSDDGSRNNDDDNSSNKEHENTSLLQKNFGKKSRGSGSNAGTKNLSSLKKKSKHNKCVQLFCFNHVMHGNSLSKIKRWGFLCIISSNYFICCMYIFSIKIFNFGTN